ncbi:hypothetical protein [Lachnoclostridium phytofermentans]|uniref:Uncharacterized protein n=1 Tax=Lachnoclostridium phytofermentans (strain ATCC 700394 / DSM 18823 / ISDg) TaxID=357809 RepID=A9KLM9_LACP7|nr:hypothetical protein [Lachnoclostridium phytofermentans]ABX42773.1 hypothetical protein Cphy_2412 [Lachnoclostridium phytofermentans ISDg]
MLRKSTRWMTWFMLFLFIFFLASKTAKADLIIEPDDAFYRSHRSSCTYVSRSFIANGEEGYSSIYVNPESKLIVDKVTNGTEFYVSFSYDKQNSAWVYCLVPIYAEDGSVSYKKGWIPEKDCLLKYDGIAFCDDHISELKEYQGEFEQYQIKKEIFVWSYPGSGEIAKRFKEFDPSRITSVYTDEQGQTWGYIQYHLGQVNAWVCISDPENEDLPVRKIVKGDLIPPVEPEWGLKDGKNLPFLSAAVLVVAVAAGTILLIRRFYKRK